MNIKLLFDELDIISKDKLSNEIFKDSGVINKYKELDFGFFPLGAGILTGGIKREEAKIEPGGIMILGNDFGTDKKYLTKECIEKNKMNESITNPTVRNLIAPPHHFPLKSTFFTNFYLGVRDDETYPKTTMRIRERKLESRYKELCLSFFRTQLDIINPGIVICLGHEVRKALVESSTDFEKWRSNNKTIKQHYKDGSFIINSNDNEFGSKFMLSPHPCYSRNFTSFYIEKIKEAIKHI